MLLYYYRTPRRPCISPVSYSRILFGGLCVSFSLRLANVFSSSQSAVFFSRNWGSGYLWRSLAFIFSSSPFFDERFLRSVAPTDKRNDRAWVGGLSGNVVDDGWRRKKQPRSATTFCFTMPGYHSRYSPTVILGSHRLRCLDQAELQGQAGSRSNERIVTPFC